MNVLDLFSGIGGFSLGLERAGMRTVAFCEIEPYARGVLAKHWPDIPCHDDITTREFRKGEADVICGGFPCQDISLAGDGAGLAGKRSGLWGELLRAIRVVRPRYAIVENVAALLSRGLDTVLGDLAEIGYDAEWHCIPASAVGAPHRRDRIWIIADAGSEQHKSDRSPLSGPLSEELSRSMANAEGDRWLSRGPCDAPEVEGGRESGRGCFSSHNMENPKCVGRDEVEQSIVAGSPGEGAADTPEHAGLSGRRCWWAIEPDVGRVAHGIPARVDRLKGLGNAVVPKIPEIIGRAIMSLR